MTPDQLFHEYQNYQSYIGWTDADANRVRTAANLLDGRLEFVIDDFYAEVARHPETRKIIAESRTTSDRLKATLRQWLKELLEGPRDRDYVMRRWQVGKRHVEIGLKQVYVSTAMARLRASLVETLIQSWTGERDGLALAILSLSKLIDLDLTVIENAYQTEYGARIRQNEQLAKVGHIAGSIGHELRVPLNVFKSSAYYLRHTTTPTKTSEHFERIDSSMEITEQILLDLSDFAGRSVPQLAPFPVEECVEGALVQARLRDGIQLARRFPSTLPLAMGDRDQIRNVLLRIIRHAQDSMRDGGQLSIDGQSEAKGVDVVFADTGASMSKDMIAAIMTPLSWSSVRVLGMNLAIARALLDMNGGCLLADEKSDRGNRITVKLAAAAGASA